MLSLPTMPTASSTCPLTVSAGQDVRWLNPSLSPLPTRRRSARPPPCWGGGHTFNDEGCHGDELRGGTVDAVVILASSRCVGAEHQRGLGLGEGSSFLEDRRDVGVGDEPRPPLLVHVEQPPDPLLLGGIAEHRRTFGAVEGALFGGLCAEQLQESVDVLDGRRCQDHDFPPSE